MERGMTADQVLGALWRRKALVSAIAVGVFALGATFVASLPNVYTSTAVVRVEPQRPTPEMVQRTVSELIEQRLLTVRQELLARPVMQRAIEELNLYPEIVQKKGMDAAVERMRKDLEVKVEGENAFELTYSSNNPETAAKVANRLPEIYAEQALKVRQGQASRAAQLFGDEVTTLKKQLSDWEQKIIQFKVAHMGELPEQLEMNMRGLERIGAQLSTKSEELRVAESRRSDLARAHFAADTEAGRMLAMESGLTRELVGARSQWTGDHPEVKRLEGELEAMKEKRREAEGRMYAERQEKSRVTGMIAAIETDIAQLHKQAEAFQARLDRTPRWAHELAVLQTDYDATKTKYQSVMSRKVEAELAQDLEMRSAKHLFNVVSPAGVPTGPAKPDRLGGMAIALLLALALAVLTAVILEMRDDSLRDTAEVKERLPIPVLAVVPNLQGGKVEKRVLMPAATTTRNTATPPTTPLN
ncbi:MAG TPA: Wzz/FepE/Etk N-terminal domain-containing protein [Myxococcaceae bacterium]|nr:Wzz/FepE/Etk N-terminal domain-containing protein [Myxococcaceae bacterium]